MKLRINAFIFLFIWILSSAALISANVNSETKAKCSLLREDKVEWTKYYNSEEMLCIMKELEKKFPTLSKIYTIGKSYLGKDLHLMEITNRQIKPALEKPAIYIDGNMHTGEQTGAMLTLYMIYHLLNNYGKDERITRLVDNFTFYLRPKYQVDASDWWLENPGDTDYGGSVRPRDNDLDGEFDEDGQEDLNGDGFITWMRIIDLKGEWKVSEKDPRAMVRREPHEMEGTFYRLLSEGIDNDGDGKFNEDGLGGVNLSHNFSWGNRNREQILSSPYTMSEPETRATVEFWMSHPNIFMAIDLHTSGSVEELLYFPGGEDMPPSDFALFKHFASAYAKLTQREEVLPLMKEFPQPIWRLGMGDPEPFIYYYMGVFGWCEELWGDDYANPFLRKYDLDKNKIISQDEILAFLDNEAGGRWFIPWKKFSHPQLGEVEIGGLVHKFTTQNPPPEFLEKELKFKLPWYLYLTEMAPRVKIKKAEVKNLEGNIFSLKVTIENQGFLPTNITEWATKTGLAKPVTVELICENALILEGEQKVKLGHIPGNQVLSSSEGLPENRRSTFWVIKKIGKRGKAKIKVISEKAGTESQEVIFE